MRNKSGVSLTALRLLYNGTIIGVAEDRQIFTVTAKMVYCFLAWRVMEA